MTDTPPTGISVPEHKLRIREDLLWQSPAGSFEELFTGADSALAVIEGSADIRVIVLEAWLLTDFVLREFLMAGLWLHSVNNEGYDLRYELLPRSFDGLLRLVAKIRDTNLPLPEATPGRMRLPVGFVMWLKQNHGDALDQFLNLEKAYLQEHRPDALPPMERRPPFATTAPWPVANPRVVDSIWLLAAQQINASWQSRALQLNKARNYAAHSQDRTRIAQALGYAGPSVLEHSRRHVQVLISDLLGIVRSGVADPGPSEVGMSTGDG